MWRELLASLKDSLECGDLLGHLRAFWRVYTGQVSPFHSAGVPAPTAQHDSGEGGAARPGEPQSPRACPSFGADRETGRHPLLLAVQPLNIMPAGSALLLAHGRALLNSIPSEPTTCYNCGADVAPEASRCPICGQCPLPL